MQVSFPAAPGGHSNDIVPQAYVSFKPGSASGLQIDFGQFISSTGAELSNNEMNRNQSKSLIYASGPGAHAGLRVTHPPAENFTVGFHFLNGWNNVEDNNTGRTPRYTITRAEGNVSRLQT